MFVGQGTTWTLTALTLALLPRYLGPEHMGQLGVALSFEVVASSLAGLGLGTLITREVARDRDSAARLLGTAIWLNVGFGLLAAAIIIGLGFQLGYGGWTKAAIATIAITSPLNLLILLGFGALQGAEVMRFQAVIDVSNKIFLLIFLGLIVFLDLGFGAYLALSFASAAFTAVPSLVLAHRNIPFDLLSFSFKHARRLVMEGIPFASVGIVVVVYVAVDTILLSLLAGETAVGIYAAPARIWGTLLFAPTIITTVVFPRMAATAMHDPAELRRIARISLQVVVGLTLPAAVIGAGAGRELLVDLIGSEYSDSAAVMAVMSCALVPTSIAMVAHRILLSVDRQRIWTAVMAGGLVVKVVLSIALVPLFSRLFGNAALGAATSLALTETAIMSAGFVLMPHSIVGRETFRLFGRLALAAVVALALMVFTSSAGFLVAGVTGGAAYAAVALVTRAYTLKGIETALRWVVGRETGGALHLPLTAPMFDPSFIPLVLEPGRLKGNREATLPARSPRRATLPPRFVGGWQDARDLHVMARGPRES